MLQHIALDICKTDIEDFYITILGGMLDNNIVLPESAAKNIFQIRKKVQIYFININDITLELFENDVVKRSSFQHICISHDKMMEIYREAKDKGYWTYLRKSKNSNTCFVKDKNGNLFEIKRNV